MMKARKFVGFLVLLMAGFAMLSNAQAETRFYKPYILAQQSQAGLTDVLEQARAALTAGGMSIVGEYSPYEGAHTLVVTNDTLRQVAARSEFGGYGAVLRVGVTQVGDTVQVAYTNPAYMKIIYRMAESLDAVGEVMAGALGNIQEFGSDTGFTEFELASYHYMIFMPYFTDQLKLASHDGYEAALKAVESGLAAGRDGTKKIYRVDLPGKDETLFGVALSEGAGADRTVMATTDVAPLKHTPHLPYELLISGGKVYALHGKFRIAQSFPDLTMGTFMKISKAPDSIEDALKAAAGGK